MYRLGFPSIDITYKPSSVGNTYNQIMDLDKYVPDRIQNLRGSIWTELAISIVIMTAILAYLYLVLFRTQDALQGVNQPPIIDILAVAYGSSPIYMKGIIGALSILFSLSVIHSVVYPVSESFKTGSTREEILGEFNSVSPGLFTSTAMPLLFGIGIYSSTKWILERLSVALTPEILGGIVITALFVGVYIAEFSTYPDKNRSLFTSIMYMFLSDGLEIYESGINKSLFILGAAFTQEGSIGIMHRWRDKVITQYKYDRKMLILASDSREDIDDWCFDADEVSSMCSFCDEFDGKCLEFNGDGFVVGAPDEDTDKFCVCHDCRTDILKAGVEAGHMDEAVILTHEI